ncbi:MAG: hypothetical protein GYB16_05065 [Gammaproteobacteria bacterium]|nr:hypothetical protein [Gammaproteobacteria bacterium]
MKNWIFIFVICFLVIGCAATNKPPKSAGKGMLLMSTDTSYIVDGKQIDKTNGEAFLSAIDATGFKKLIVIERDIEHLLTLREQLKAKGYSLYYIDSERRVKAVSL